MQNLNKDMDELFRDAANHYPLKTDSANWNALSEKLNTPDQRFAPVNKFTANKLKYAALFLLLLLPAAWFLNKYFFQPEPAQPVKQTKVQAHAPAATNGDNQKQHEQASGSAINSNRIKATAPDNDAEEVSLKKQFANPAEKFVENIFYSEGEDAVPVITNSASKLEENIQSTLGQAAEKQKEKILHQPANIILSQAKTSIVKTNQNISADRAAEKQSIQIKGQKHFYAGALAGTNFSTIKFQSVKSPGFNYGMILGYSINKHFNIEVSIIKGTEHYFTYGRYFNADKIRIPRNSRIARLEAKTNITEMPVALRYNITSAKQSQVFATLGATSYIIHKEQYNYELKKNGSRFDSDKLYERASNNFLANLHLSAGYEHSLNKVGNVRIEPYYQLPLKNVGLGSVPVTNFGVNIAFTRYIK